MENQNKKLLETMRYMGIDVNAISDAIKKSEYIASYGIADEEDKNTQCELLHANTRERFYIELHENECDDVTHALVKSYLNESKAILSERLAPDANIDDVVNKILTEKILTELESVKEQENNIITKTDEERINKWLKEQIEDICTDGHYIVSPSGYDDYISEETVMKAYDDYTSDNSFYSSFEDFLYDRIQETFDDSIYEEIKSLIDERATELSNFDYHVYKEMFDEKGLYELCYENGFEGIDIKLEEFLNHDYRLNFLLATEQEATTDMQSISERYINVDSKEYGKTDDDYHDSLTYLIRQQGYDPEDVYKTSPQSAFIESVKEELDIIDNDYNLTVLCHSQGRELLDLLEKLSKNEGYIEIEKSATLGLYESYMGAGSELGIDLAKNLVIPSNMVNTIQFENTYSRRQNNGYTVNTTYGLITSCWKAEAKVTDTPPVLEKNTFNKKRNNEQNIER